MIVFTSVAEPPGATSFEATPEPEPSADILVGWSRNLNHFLMAGGKLKRNVLLLYYVNMKSAQFVKRQNGPKMIFYLLIIKFFRAEISRLRDLGTSGAAKKSGGSATLTRQKFALVCSMDFAVTLVLICGLID